MQLAPFHLMNRYKHHATTITLFGIRHHGAGSARGLLRSLREIKPDAILVEGPPEGNGLIHWLGHPDLTPPVALLVYRPDKPNQAGFFPFAIFSPELQAMQYGLRHKCLVRFFDLPQAHMLAVPHKPQMPETAVFQQLAQASGHRDYEQWWNVTIEQRQNSQEMFAAILELMQTLRNAAIEDKSTISIKVADSTKMADTAKIAEQLALSIQLANQREASMRQTMRQAIADGYQNIAVVCGAWHSPALLNLDNETEDKILLTDMPTVNVEAAWVPWTYGRLSTMTGYGAGVHSPGWYHHLWQMGQANAAPTELASPTELSIHWLTKVATLLRNEELDTSSADASSAHIIETVRLAEALATMRHLPFPGLPELNEATQTVMCAGDDTPMKLIKKKLIIGERMGAIPAGTPMTPLQRDLQQWQQKLRLYPMPELTARELDLRQEIDRQRSHLLHRLNLLQIPWGKFVPIRSRSGTYQESWKLRWQPDFAIRIIEANIWGATVQDAAAAFAQDAADKAESLPALTKLLDDIILADLPEAVIYLMQKIEDASAMSSDVPHMMDAVQPLARILRYGNVRKTDQQLVQHVVDGLITRICIGLPSTCASMDDAAAIEMIGRLTAVNSSIMMLRQTNHLDKWHNSLKTLTDQPKLHGLLAGKSCRLLLDGRAFSAEEVAMRMERALSLHAMVDMGIEQLTQMVAWIEGFLKGNGLVILHDPTLWQLLDTWVTQMNNGRFQSILPLLRRTFSSFSEATRNQINQRTRRGKVKTGDDRGEGVETVLFDEVQANAVLPLAAKLLGIKK